jgi:hypothetical protein
MPHVQRALVCHRRLVRAAWLVVLVVMGAGQPDGNGGGY